MRTAESPPRAPPFWPPLKSEWRVWRRELNKKVIMKKVSITLKAVDVFDYGAADFLAGHLEDMKWGYINCSAFDRCPCADVFVKHGKVRPGGRDSAC